MSGPAEWEQRERRRIHWEKVAAAKGQGEMKASEPGESETTRRLRRYKQTAEANLRLAERDAEVAKRDLQVAEQAIRDHMRECLVGNADAGGLTPGQRVKAGTALGQSGNTGFDAAQQEFYGDDGPYYT